MIAPLERHAVPMVVPDSDVYPLIELDSISCRVGSRDLLDAVSLRVNPGEFLAILGPNGAGKSTLLSMMNATLHPLEGGIRLFGQDPWSMSERNRARLRARIGIVPQRTDFNPLIPLTVREVADLGRLQGRAFSSRLSRQDVSIVDESLERMGIADLACRAYRSLSGGEQQKVQIARALAQNPALLLLDEPASGLDLRWQEQLTGIIEQLSQTMHLPIVMTTHILSHLPACCGRVSLIRGGRILFDGPAGEALSAAKLGDLYEYPVEVLERNGRRYCLSAVEDKP